MQPHASVPKFEAEPSSAGMGDMPGGTHGADYDAGSGSLSEAALAYRAQFQSYMPGYETQVSQVDASRRADGMIEVRHADGSGTAFYDKTMYQSPRGL